MATPKQKIAQRQKANAAVLSNLSALRQGVSSIPGRVVKYIKTSTPVPAMARGGIMHLMRKYG